MSLFGKEETKETITFENRKFEGRQATIVLGLIREKEKVEHELALERRRGDSLEERNAILEETINVLRDALAAHQVTSQLHAAEGKTLIAEVSGQRN